MTKRNDDAFVTWDALAQLVERRIPESATLEFKRAPYAGSEKAPDRQRHERDELRRDVTSLANAGGGWLVVGIAEGSQGEAESLHPIPAIREHETRTRDVLSERVQPPFGIALHVRAVPSPTSDGSGALAIRVDGAAPHHPYGFARESGPVEFWLRCDKSKRPMTYEQIARAFSPTGEEIQALHISAIARSRVQDLAFAIRSSHRRWEQVRSLLTELKRFTEHASLDVRKDVVRAAYEAIDYPRAGLPIEVAQDATGVLRDALPLHSLVGRQGTPPDKEELEVLEEAAGYLWPLVYDGIRYLAHLPTVWAGAEVASDLLRFALLNDLSKLRDEAEGVLKRGIDVAKELRDNDALRLLTYAVADARDPDALPPKDLWWVISPGLYRK